MSAPSHRLEGRVVTGDRRGRLLGYPTANIDVEVGELPEDGIYAGRIERADGSMYVAAISVGRRPTFYMGDADRLLEAYLLDFDGDLYGELLVVTVEQLVRKQLRFDSRNALVEQMRTDVQAVRDGAASRGGGALTE